MGMQCQARASIMKALKAARDALARYGMLHEMEEEIQYLYHSSLIMLLLISLYLFAHD